jgi:hypothetical protein
MHHRARDLTGFVVGYLTLTTYAGSDGTKSLWHAKCVCGKTITIPGTEAVKQQKRGIRASCGCMRRATISEKLTTHGMSRHPAFAVWRSMIDRCTLPTHQAWRNYGGRGIGVCEEWRASFAAFWSDMGPTYLHGLTLERKDNSAGYSAANCTWATTKRQANNTRRSRVIETPAGKMTAMQASEAYGVGYSTLLYRLDHDWPVLRALNLSSIC